MDFWLASLQRWWSSESRPRPCPVCRTETVGDEVVVHLSPRAVLADALFAVARVADIGAPLPAGDMPPVFWHCTSVESGLSILETGLRSANELQLDDVHKPDGIYSYCLQRESKQSMYFTGCQVEFHSTARALLTYNESLAMRWVPPG